MRPLIVLLGVLGLSAATQKTHRKYGKGLSASMHTSANPSLTLRQSCSIGQTECDSLYCMPDSGTCCSDGIGSYCPSGQYCVSGGCCPDGELCTGDGSSDSDDSSSDDSSSDDSDSLSGECDSDEEKCGSYRCMPKGSVCCEDTGWYCDAGETCDGVLCESGSSGSSSSSSDDDDDGSSDDSTLCKRKGGKGGGGGGVDVDGGGDDDDECAAAGVTIPALLAGMVAAVSLLL
jgi:hypothetical protein